MKPGTRDVLAFLRYRGGLGVTPAEARIELGTDRLAARVQELRAEGYPIRSEWVMVNGSRFARYVLDEAPLPVPDRGTQIGAGL